MKSVIITKSEDETFKLGEKIGQTSKKGDVFALYGELGTGKTVLAKGIARGMGIADEITSPTFLLMEIYKNTIPLYHFDLYRIENEDEIDNLDFEDYWEGSREDSRGVSVIEWANNAQSRIPKNAVKISLIWLNEKKRKIEIEYPGN